MHVETQSQRQRQVWNTGRIIGPRPPLKPRHIWATRTRLQHDGRIRDLAMFNLAIDSKLRGCDLVRLRVADVVLGGLRAWHPPASFAPLESLPQSGFRGGEVAPDNKEGLSSGFHGSDEFAAGFRLK